MILKGTDLQSPEVTYKLLNNQHFLFYLILQSALDKSQPVVSSLSLVLPLFRIFILICPVFSRFSPTQM
ncbi:hypothetical protein BDV36DRAFT_138241 [Aspergillus pseudocaelatus]|uniref:Uncharacterized protein n=1 Tax=Aspergillus pseudocaelatus TaxID=1825620 RepID=A0ABQ6VZ86_9EURO|nr:hypothetical protein BDV36DRAFT_138241 [Aspergillus pseudocaelatus]